MTRKSDYLFFFFIFFKRAWLLKLLAIELHAADLSSPIHREACQSILAHLYGQEIVDIGSVPGFSLQHHVVDPGTRTTSKSKVLYSTLTFHLHMYSKWILVFFLFKLFFFFKLMPH